MRFERRLTIILLLLSAGLLCAMFFAGTIVANPLSNLHQNQTIRPDDTFADFNGPVTTAADRLFAPPRSDAQPLPQQEHPPWESLRYGLLLKGTAGTDMAVIQDTDTRRERVVRPGESYGNARIESIHRNRVVLDGPLGREVLERPASAPSPQNSTDRPAETGPEQRGGNAMGQNTPRIIERRQLRALIGQVETLGREITLQPVRRADGTPAGFRVTATKPRGILAGMGVRRRDILTAVNQREIVTLEDVYRVLESAVHQNTLTLSILRNDAEMELNYVVR